jgi:hypothetical protein
LRPGDGRTVVAPIEPRYEYRVWGTRLDEVAARIRALSVAREERSTTETYLVSHSMSHVNPKIRAGLLDIKVLLGVFDGFERWEPRLKTGFPVDADVIRDDVFPLLGLTEPPLNRDWYDVDQLLAEVVVPHPSLQALTVHKQRATFLLAGCLAEIADVRIDDHMLQTAAVESADPAALRKAVEIAGVDNHPNVSYPKAIKQVLGRHPAPPASGAAWPAR